MLPRNPLVCKIVGIVSVVIAASILIMRRDAVITMERYDYARVTLGLDEVRFQGLQKDTVDQTEELAVMEEDTTTTTEVPMTTVSQLFINAEEMEYELNTDPCPNTNFYLMIYVHSSPENAERRRIVRKTWASKEILTQYKAKLVFLMGSVDDPNLQASLINESELYKDIVQANFTDTYRNLTYKAIMSLRWVSQNCDSATYVLKTDDDIVVDIHRVVRLMHSFIEKKWGTSNLLACHIWQHMNVERNKTSKWYTSEDEFPKNFFLKYCSGSAFIMSKDVVHRLYNATFETPFFWIDDYYLTGMLAKQANVSATSMNDRYILENDADIYGILKNDTKTRRIYIHSPNSEVSLNVWKNFLDRW